MPDPSLTRRRRRTAQVTMAEVAARAGVSPSTVSLYLRKPDAVAARSAQQVAKAIKDLGYVPNLMAGGLAAAGSRVVSIIVPSVRNAFFAETVSTLQSALSKAGLQVLLGHSDYSQTIEEALVRAALSWSPAAIVLTGLSHSETTRTLLQNARMPVIEMWELGAPPIDMVVGFSHREVGGTAARHLIHRGRKRLAFLGARLGEDRRAAQRADGFMATASEAGLPAILLNHPAPASPEAGAALLARLMDNHGDCDAVACSNDIVALGLLFEAERRGLRVPDQISVVGFGDLEFCASCNPSLTTIRPSGDIIGREVARLILDCLGKQGRPVERVLNTSHLLITRLSA